MKKILPPIVLCCGIFANQPMKAQYYYYNDRFYDTDLVYEFGSAFGIMNCFTDLGGKRGIGKNFIKDLNWKNSKLSGGIYFMAMYQNKVGVRLGVTFGNITAYDSILKPVAPTTYGRYERNLSFKSTINDFQLCLEIHPVFIFGNYYEGNPPRWSPYAVAGIGYFSFDPQAILNGRWYSLQPLHTEGQGFAEYRRRKPYKLNQINYPVGLGVKYELSSYLNMRIELVHRILTTDYLDDASTSYIDPALFANYLTPQQALVAELLADRQYETIPGHITAPGEQRGDPRDKDAFFTIQLKIGLTLGRERRK